MSLSARVKRIEAAHTPQSRVRCIVVTGQAEAEAREAQMLATGEIHETDTVVFLLTGVPRSSKKLGASCLMF
jgi:hypothetical protein